MPGAVGASLAAIVQDRCGERQVILFPGRPSFRILPEVGSGTLTVRCVAHAYAAMLVRTPATVGKLTGAGLALPVFTA